MASGNAGNAEEGNSGWHDFSQDVSMHGLRFTTLKTMTIIRRVSWVLLILLSLSYFLYAASTFLRDYTNKKLITNIRMEKALHLPFPTVTICNNNNFRRSSLYWAGVGLNTFGLWEVLRDLYDTNRQAPPPIEKYNWTDPEYAPIYAINGSESEKFLKDAAHPLTNSLEGCFIFGRRYNCSDVMEVVSTDAGFCYQFNSNGTLNSTSAGKAGGILMLMHAVVDEYSIGPRSHSEGFSLTFHNWYEVPQVTQQSVGLFPGSQASVMLHKSETSRYPPPADHGRANCFDTIKKENPLINYPQYSYSGCQVECKAQYVLERCRCKDLLQPPYANATTCSIAEMLYCSNPAMREFTTDPEGLEACECKDPCIDNEFIAKISNYKFPSTNYIQEQDLDPGVTEWMRANSILVEIFYGKMSYQRLEEDRAYTIEDMVANVGGTLGLCIGASILTICEFFEFGFLSLSRLFCKKKLKTSKGSIGKVQPANVEAHNKEQFSDTHQGWL